VARLDHYQPEELVAIVNRSARLLGLDLTTEGAEEISGRSRGTPRLALRLLRRVRDFVEVRGCQVATLEEARAGLDRFGVDELGLDHVDRTILETLCLRFSGRPVGLSTLAISVGEEPETVEDVYEPFLLKAGLMQRTPRGRIATEAAYEHLGVDIPDTLVQLGPLGFSASRGGGGASRAPGRPPRLFEADMDEGAQEAPEAGSG
jgi:Holliday junction DNA helicase RuvB